MTPCSENVERKRHDEVHAFLASALVAGVRASMFKTRTEMPAGHLYSILVRAHVENGARAFITEHGEGVLDAATIEKLHWATKSEDKSWRNTLRDAFGQLLESTVKDVDTTRPRDPDTDFDQSWCEVPFWGQKIEYPQPRALVLDPVVFLVPMALGARERVPARVDRGGHVWVPWRVGVLAKAGPLEVWLGIENSAMPTENLMRIESALARWQP